MAETMMLRAVSLGTAAGLVALAAVAAFTMRFQSITSLFPEDAPIITLPEPEPPPLEPPEPIARDPLPEPFTPADLDIVDAFPPTPNDGFTSDPPGPTVITQPTWIQRPNGGDFARHYPDRALARDREGRVVLDCVVAASGRINCAIASEEPAGWGFGAAALEIAHYFQMSPAMADGQPTEGGRVRVPISFRLAR